MGLKAVATNGGGGGGTPGGSSGQVQYNSSGSFAGSSSITVNTNGTLNATPQVISVTGTTKTFALTDANTIQDCNNAGAQTLTIPPNSSVAFPVNSVIQCELNGSGASLTISAGAGVTLYANAVSVSSCNTTTLGSAFYLRKEATNTWYAIGIPGGGSGITALTGDVTASGSGSVAATVAKIAGVAVGTPTGTGNVVFSNSPTLVTPALGTPASGVATNLTGTASGLTAGTVSTISGLITNGTNITITGSGTSGSPYSIAASGGGGGGASNGIAYSFAAGNIF